jgi:DNA primase
MLDRLPQLNSVYLGLDNDKAGHAASQRMVEQIEERGIAADRLVPENKDWNDDLIARREMRNEVIQPCQTLEC